MLIILAPYKFTDYHYIHFELDIFEKKLKKKFEVHDLSNILNPRTRFIFKTKRHKKTKVFFSIDEWKIYFDKINKKYDKLIILNLLDLTSFKSLVIHYLIKKTKRKIIQIKSPGLPNVYLELNKNNFFVNFKKKIKLLKFKFLIYHFKNKLIKYLIKFISFNKILYLVRGSKINFEIELNSKKKEFINYHSHDFSRVSLYKKKKQKIKSIGIFLDTPDPYFDDDFSLFGLKLNYNKLKWYKDLNNFLFEVEKEFACRIIIILHPKVKGFKNPYYDKKFEVNDDIDAVHKLIPESKIVVSQGASTAIGIAIACKKRVILTYNEQVKRFNFKLIERIKFIAKKSGANCINLNNYDKKNLIKDIDKQKYNKYFYDYISSKKISKKKNYEILNEVIYK